jgi:hypothetical protein
MLSIVNHFFAPEITHIVCARMHEHNIAEKYGDFGWFFIIFLSFLPFIEKNHYLKKIIIFKTHHSLP